MARVTTFEDDDTTDIITIHIGTRPDGGARVWSDDLPGLILSGPDREKISQMIIPTIDFLRGLHAAWLKDQKP